MSDRDLWRRLCPGQSVDERREIFGLPPITHEPPPMPPVRPPRPEPANPILTIRAPANAGRGVRVADNTRFMIGDTELPNVTRCVVAYEVNCIVMATLDIAISPDEDITAHPLLSLDCVRKAALHYGYDLAERPRFTRGIDGVKVKAK